ncbi:hypothetical protein WG66_009087 [Moniliophthora roreri]|nr:hypothetical protein WG66_009087 [Moniliophthora roreri]
MRFARPFPVGVTTTDWWQRFDCPWDQLLTFELACHAPDRLGDDGCWLEWWRERQDKDSNSEISTV